METDYPEELKDQMEAVEALISIFPSPSTGAHPLLKSEVKIAIKTMKPHKSLGSDVISAEIIKSGGEVLCEHLYELVANI